MAVRYAVKVKETGKYIKKKGSGLRNVKEVDDLNEATTWSHKGHVTLALGDNQYVDGSNWKHKKILSKDKYELVEVGVVELATGCGQCVHCYPIPNGDGFTTPGNVCHVERKKNGGEYNYPVYGSHYCVFKRKQ